MLNFIRKTFSKDSYTINQTLAICLAMIAVSLIMKFIGGFFIIAAGFAVLFCIGALLASDLAKDIAKYVGCYLDKKN